MEANRQYYLQLLKIGIMEDKIADWLENRSDSEDLDKTLRGFCRIAIECKQLEDDEGRCVPTNADQEDEKNIIVERTMQLRSKYAELLNDRFVYTLRRYQELLLGDDANMTEKQELEAQALAYFECYHMLEKEELASELFRDHVCKEVVGKVLSWTVTGNQRNAPPEALQPLFVELLQEIKAHCIPWVKLASQVSSNFRLIRSIWRCVMEVIVKRMQNIFSPGIQSKFHTHYVIAQKLLLGLEAHVSTMKELDDFRKSEEMEQWNSKWLLTVYIALRQKEVMGELNTTMQQCLQRQTEDGIQSTGYSFLQVSTVHRLIFWLWGESVFLYPLGDQLMKMTLRTINVLDKWLAGYWQAPIPEPTQPVTHVDADGVHPIPCMRTFF